MQGKPQIGAKKVLEIKNGGTEKKVNGFVVVRTDDDGGERACSQVFKTRKEADAWLAEHPAIPMGG